MKFTKISLKLKFNIKLQLFAYRYGLTYFLLLNIFREGQTQYKLGVIFQSFFRCSFIFSHSSDVLFFGCRLITLYFGGWFSFAHLVRDELLFVI
jgi:hypothetical protein